MADYLRVIEKYEELHRRVTAQELVESWDLNDRNLNVYVHSPFCSTLCRFCYYKGVDFDRTRDADLYTRFYDDYLPAAVAPFVPVIEQNTIGNYFFGGGTPSLMTPETMSSVFDLFPDFRSVRSKTFEIHPAVYCDEQLDVLAEYGFNCCIIGIQSFDEAVLQRQNRLHASPEVVADLVEKIKARGMSVSGDIIFHMDAIDAEQIFRSDIAHLADIDFDLVSLQQNYDLSTKDDLTTLFLDIVRESEFFENYYWSRAKGPGDELPSIDRKSTMKCLRCIRNDVPWSVFKQELFPFISTSDEVSKWEQSKIADRNCNSTIGFGSFRNPRKNTFSNIVSTTKCMEYIEINNNWRPEYYVTYSCDKQQELQEFAEALQKIKAMGDLPDGIHVGQMKSSWVDRDQFIHRKRTNRELMHVVSWQEKTPEVSGFIDRMSNVFPKMEIQKTDEGEFVLL